MPVPNIHLHRGALQGRETLRGPELAEPHVPIRITAVVGHSNVHAAAGSRRAEQHMSTRGLLDRGCQHIGQYFAEGTPISTYRELWLNRVFKIDQQSCCQAV